MAGSLEGVQDGFDEEFGFGARDEDGRAYAEREAEELLCAEDVLDGLEAEAALDQALVSGLLVAGDGALGVREQGGAFDAEGVHQQQRGVGDGGGPQIGMRGELARRRG